MFATLQVNHDSNSIEEVGTIANRLACLHCRSKKLKCTGEKEGCARCKSRDIQCEYLEIPHGKGSRIKAKTKPCPQATKLPKISAQFRTTQDRRKPKVEKQRAVPKNRYLEAAGIAPAADQTFTQSTVIEGLFPEQMTLTEPLLDVTSEDYAYLNDGSLEGDMQGLDNGYITDFSWLGDLHFNTTGLSNAPDLGDTARRQSNLSGIIGSDGDSPQPLSTDATAMSSLQSPVNAVESTAGLCPRLYESFDSQTSLRSDDSLMHGHSSCFKTALLVLEALNIQNFSITRQSLAQALRLDKNALARCKQLFHCEICSNSSSFFMLLIVLCQTITSSYERIMAVLTQETNDAHLSQGKISNETATPSLPLSGSLQSDVSSARPPEENSLEVEQQMNLYGYEIDIEERSVVFSAIARVQLQTLQSLLIQMRRHLDDSSWLSHVSLVDLTGNKINTLLEQSSNGTLSFD
ncbi:MAG: hypothetical protein Q9160_006665 [Pyrenula sp. 1 TL-2023]